MPSIGFCSCHSRAASSSFRSVFDRPLVASLTSSSSMRGRNSCSGGSSSRTVTGSPSMASRISRKSSFWATRSSSSAAASSFGVAARIMRRTIGRRSSPRNMCSVRHRPMPSAPNCRALVASGPLSALARTAELALPHLVGPAEDGLELGRRLGRRQRDRAEHDLAGGAVEGDDVALLHGHVAGGEVVGVDADRLGAHHRRDAPARGPRRRRG